MNNFFKTFKGISLFIGLCTSCIDHKLLSDRDEVRIDYRSGIDIDPATQRNQPGGSVVQPEPQNGEGDDEGSQKPDSDHDNKSNLKSHKSKPKSDSKSKPRQRPKLEPGPEPIINDLISQQCENPVSEPTKNTSIISQPKTTDSQKSRISSSAKSNNSNTAPIPPDARSRRGNLSGINIPILIGNEAIPPTVENLENSNNTTPKSRSSSKSSRKSLCEVDNPIIQEILEDKPINRGITSTDKELENPVSEQTPEELKKPAEPTDKDTSIIAQPKTTIVDEAIPEKSSNINPKSRSSSKSSRSTNRGITSTDKEWEHPVSEQTPEELKKPAEPTDKDTSIIAQPKTTIVDEAIPEKSSNINPKSRSSSKSSRSTNLGISSTDKKCENPVSEPTKNTSIMPHPSITSTEGSIAEIKLEEVKDSIEGLKATIPAIIENDKEFEHPVSEQTPIQKIDSDIINKIGIIDNCLKTLENPKQDEKNEQSTHHLQDKISKEFDELSTLRKSRCKSIFVANTTNLDISKFSNPEQSDIIPPPVYNNPFDVFQEPITSIENIGDKNSIHPQNDLNKQRENDKKKLANAEDEKDTDKPPVTTGYKNIIPSINIVSGIINSLFNLTQVSTDKPSAPNEKQKPETTSQQFSNLLQAYNTASKSLKCMKNTIFKELNDSVKPSRVVFENRILKIEESIADVVIKLNKTITDFTKSELKLENDERGKLTKIKSEYEKNYNINVNLVNNYIAIKNKEFGYNNYTVNVDSKRKVQSRLIQTCLEIIEPNKRLTTVLNTGYPFSSREIPNPKSRR